MDTLGNDNAGYRERKALSAGSKYLEVDAKLHLGFFNQPKPLKSRVDMKIDFTVNEPAFAIMAPNDAQYKFEITEPVLIIERLKNNFQNL